MQNDGVDDVEIRVSYRLVAVAFGATSFGIGYALVINEMERRRIIEQRSSWFVALGVAATLLARRFLPGAGNIVFDFLAFFFTGVPMIANQVLTKRRLVRQFAAAKEGRGVTHDHSNGVAFPRERR